MKSNIIFFIISRSLLLKIRNVSNRGFREQTFYVEQRFTKIVPFMRKCGKML